MVVRHRSALFIAISEKRGYKYHMSCSGRTRVDRPMPKTLYSAEAAVLRRQLRAARGEVGITQAALSESLGRKQSFISDIERGVRCLDTLELWQLCNAQIGRAHV